MRYFLICIIIFFISCNSKKPDTEQLTGAVKTFLESKTKYQVNIGSYTLTIDKSKGDMLTIIEVKVTDISTQDKTGSIIVSFNINMDLNLKKHLGPATSKDIVSYSINGIKAELPITKYDSGWKISDGYISVYIDYKNNPNGTYSISKYFK